jgi:hypothetical protein
MSTMRKGMIRSGSALLLGILVTLALPGEAAEPGNNTFPYEFTGRRIELQSLLAPPPNNSTITYGSVDAISPVGDQDYILLSCQGNTIKEVRVNDFYNKPNSPPTPDIDIRLYDLGGTIVGQSLSVTSEERIDVSALGHVSLYLKVWGFNGATTSSYQVAISC